MRIRWAALVLFVLAAAARAEADDAAIREVERMARALGTLEYSGVFVLAHDGRLEAMQISRAIESGQARDRVLALTGDRRELERVGSALRCATPAGVVAVDAEELGSWPPRIPASLGDARTQYRFVTVGAERIAGYEASVIEAQPRDADRYGYRFWIERNTGMLVASMLLDEARRALNQMMFTQLSMREEVAGTAAAIAAQAPPAVGAEQTPEGWRVDALPSGFALVARTPPTAVARHLVYSDGLASVSVYIEPGAPLLVGPARRGALNAYGLAVGDHRVVAVGELPPATVQRIARSVRREGS